MTAISQKKENKFTSNHYEINHIGILDGIRAIAVIIVVWFHFWQQSWIMPSIGSYSLDWIPRNGAILVDFMILLSGFCLFLPYAREMVYGTKTPSTPEFYIKRIARIMPSYYISIFIVLFCFALPLGEYITKDALWKDLLPHLFFVHNLFPESSQMTNLNGVLWTVAVEMQFYLIFPLLAKCFQKKPVVTYTIMTFIGLLSCSLISKNFSTINQPLYLNHTLTFTSVYANGMMGAWVYTSMTKEKKRIRAEEIFFLIMTLACIWFYKIMCMHHMGYEDTSRWQIDYRYPLSLLFVMFLICALLAERYLRNFLANRFMQFLAEISYNLYICHQYISVKLKQFRIPAWEGDTPPNQLGDTSWQWTYLILCILVSFVVAVAMTYLIEKPAAKLILKLYHRKSSRKSSN